MRELLWTIPALPFAGYVLLALVGYRLPRRTAGLLGTGAVGLSVLASLAAASEFLASPPAEGAWTQTLWSWWSVAGLSPNIALHFDPLAIVFTLVITGVGFLIHVYSIGYMRDDEGMSRFFAYLNLFVGSMLVLVLADNLLLLYMGWEGVGLCSYLLIGFWFQDPVNGRAARKAFIVTRVGDAAMALGLFLLFWHLDTLQIGPLLERAATQWPVGSGLALAAALLLLGGAVGKSAQLPLQTWLPDAMAGPTPVSALIHAATMVTAGVYLIARTHVIFELAPLAMTLVGVVGAATLLMAGCSALVQTDIKRVLAYSTISQIGYMFLALGVGAWSAAVFHFMTHAFFKALLFLGAGAVILALHHEQDVRKMGGLRRRLPVTFWTMMIGAASLAAFPLVSSGFYSKDMILWEAWSAGSAGKWLCGAGLLGALLTALYTSRLILLVFFGSERHPSPHRPASVMTVPLIALAALATIGGFVEIPATLGNAPVFSSFLAQTFGEHPHLTHHGHTEELLLQLTSAIVCFSGIAAAYGLFHRRRDLPRAWQASGFGRAVHALWASGWAFDRLYDLLIERPYRWVSEINRSDVLDLPYLGLSRAAARLNQVLSLTQNGQLRRYAMSIVLGAILALALVVLR